MKPRNLFKFMKYVLLIFIMLLAGCSSSQGPSNKDLTTALNQAIYSIEYLSPNVSAKIINRTKCEPPPDYDDEGWVVEFVTCTGQSCGSNSSKIYIGKRTTTSPNGIWTPHLWQVSGKDVFGNYSGVCPK